MAEIPALCIIAVGMNYSCCFNKSVDRFAVLWTRQGSASIRERFTFTARSLLIENLHLNVNTIKS